MVGMVMSIVTFGINVGEFTLRSFLWFRRESPVRAPNTLPSLRCIAIKSQYSGASKSPGLEKSGFLQE